MDRDGTKDLTGAHVVDHLPIAKLPSLGTLALDRCGRLDDDVLEIDRELVARGVEVSR